MFRALGIMIAVILVLVTAPYWLRQLNRRVLRLPARKINPVLKKLRLIHKPLGIALPLIAAVHGFLALRAFRPHTGMLAWLSLFATIALGGAFYRTKKPVLFKWHKRAALVSVLSVLLHLLFPDALSYLFG